MSSEMALEGREALMVSMLFKMHACKSLSKIGGFVIT